MMPKESHRLQEQFHGSLFFAVFAPFALNALKAEEVEQA